NRAVARALHDRRTDQHRFVRRILCNARIDEAVMKLVEARRMRRCEAVLLERIDERVDRDGGRQRCDDGAEYQQAPRAPGSRHYLFSEVEVQERRDMAEL